MKTKKTKIKKVKKPNKAKKVKKTKKTKVKKKTKVNKIKKTKKAKKMKISKNKKSLFNLFKNEKSFSFFKYRIRVRKKRCVVCAISAIVSASFLGFVYKKSFSASTTGTAAAQILVNITITETTSMDFGDIMPHDSLAGTATIPQTSDSVVCVNAYCAGGTPLRGEFAITGIPNEPFNITYTDGSLDDGGGGGAAMALTISGAAGNLTSATMSAGGTYTLYVGGILAVGANQLPGAYSTGTGGSAYGVEVLY